MGAPKPSRRRRVRTKKKKAMSHLQISLFMIYSVILIILGAFISNGRSMFTSSSLTLNNPTEDKALTSSAIAEDPFGEYLLALYESVMSNDVLDHDQLAALSDDLILFRNFGEINFPDQRQQHGPALLASYRSFMQSFLPGYDEDEEVDPDPEDNHPEEPVLPEEPQEVDPERMLFHPPKKPDYVDPELLKDTAIITMATGDTAARFAVTLMRSLINHGTQVPNLIVLLFRGGGGSADCLNSEIKKARGRPEVPCSSPDTVDWEIVSQEYLDAFDRMGVRYIVMDYMERNEYTQHIPGGESSFWGMAFNKLRVFEFFEFRKILWMDSDILVLKNIDHLLLEPDFTAAFTTDCSNPNASGKTSGGMWSFTPKQEYLDLMYDLISKPHPYNKDFDGRWHFGDMDVVMNMFANVTAESIEYLWPRTKDLNNPLIPGLRALPIYRDKTDAELLDMFGHVTRNANGEIVEGLTEEAKEWAQQAGRKLWNILDPRYDGLVGDCHSIPQRDIPDDYYSVHFTCLPSYPPVKKPANYQDEETLIYIMKHHMRSCMRHYFVMWYDTYKQAMGARFPEPLYEGEPFDVFDPELDAEVDIIEEKFRSGELNVWDYR